MDPEILIIKKYPPSVYLTSYLINILLLKVLTEQTHQDPYYLQFAIIPVVMVVNFLGMKFWSLK